MAEMNGRMNHSQCVPPPALCIQIPSLQACTEGLPLVLQRPDNFPLVMGILHEINQEKVGISICAGTYQRPLSISEVKQENADVEEHHQILNSELCLEWSLKGVEELLTEPEELQLRHDCSQQAHDPGVSHLEVCASDEKPSFALQSVQPHFGWNGSEQAQLHVDEKPLIQLQITSSLEEQVLFQENALLHGDEKPKIIEVFSALRSEVDVNSESQHAVPVSIEGHVQGKLGLHFIQAVKREPEEVEAQVPTFNKQANSSEEQKGSNGCLDACQSVDKQACIRLDRDEKFTLLGHKSQLKRIQSSEPELMQLMEKRRLSMHNVQRNTSAVLVSVADLSELEESYPGKCCPQILPHPMPPSFEPEGSICPSASSKKCQALTEEVNLQTVLEPDCCELTLSLTSSKPQSSGPSLDGDDQKPVVKPISGQKKHDGQCQRTSSYQWKQAREVCVLYEYRGHDGQDTMPEGTKKQLFPAMDGCSGKDGKKNPVPQPNAEQLLSASNCGTTESNFSHDENGSRQTWQSMPQTRDEGGSPGKRESQELLSKGGQVSEPNLPMAVESSQAEVTKLTEPQRKKMRGTLPLDEKGEVFLEEKKDTRCHRSDGKSWRCVRECINGAYYCQYHLRKRRIGYNRRKNREVNPNDLEAVSKESLKLNKKSR